MAKIRYASASGKEPIKAQLAGQKAKGASSISVNTLDGWRKNQSADFIIYALQDGNIKPGSVTSWTGLVGENTITNLELRSGIDQMYPSGSAVIATPTAARANDLVDALLTVLDADGGLKQGAVTAAAIADNAVEAKHITAKAVTADKIDFASVNKYSTEERVIGEWIDGRPVYQKTLDIIVDFKQNQYTNVPHGISGITDNFVVVSTQSAGAIGRTSGAVDRMIPRIEWQHQAGLIAVEKNNLVFASSWPWGRSRVILTIQYVK